MASTRILRPRHQGKVVRPDEQHSALSEATKPKRKPGKKPAQKRKREIKDTGSDVQEEGSQAEKSKTVIKNPRPYKKVRQTEETESHTSLPENDVLPQALQRVPTQIDIPTGISTTSSRPAIPLRSLRFATPSSQIGARHYRKYDIRDASLLTIYRQNSDYQRVLNSEPLPTPCPQAQRHKTVEPEASHPDWIAEDHFICKDGGYYRSVYHSLTEIRGGFRQPPELLSNAEARKAWLEGEKYIAKKDMDPKHGLCLACMQAVYPLDTTSETSFDYIDEWVAHRNSCWKLLTKEDEHLADIKPEIGRTYSFEV